MPDQTAAERAAASFAALQVAALMADPDLFIACARQAVADGATIDADAVVDLAVEATSRSWVIEAIVGGFGRLTPPDAVAALMADPDLLVDLAIEAGALEDVGKVWPDQAIPLYRRREANDDAKGEQP